MARINKILHLKKSATSSPAPGAGDLDYGEIAINYHADVSKIYFKDSDDTIKAINSGDQVITSGDLASGVILGEMALLGTIPNHIADDVTLTVPQNFSIREVNISGAGADVTVSSSSTWTIV